MGKLFCCVAVLDRLPLDKVEATPDGGVKVTRTGQFTDGTSNEGTYSYKYDGKESSAAATGLPFDKISVKRIDANTT